MQFKYPEILWALLLLLIPIIIHLLRLRRFKKTPFTNVAMLQRVVSESRKSQNLKKWMLLFARLLLLTTLVIAFAQPFSSKVDALRKREMVIYLDNSFSMQAKREGMSLFEKSVQNIIQEIPETSTFSLFTNDRTYFNVTIKQIQNDLLALDRSPKQLDLDQIILKANSLFSNTNDVIKEVLIISDLQQRELPSNGFADVPIVHCVQALPDLTNNVYIDSLYLGEVDGDQIPLHVQVVGLQNGETLPISLYDDDRLIAKTAVKGGAGNKTTSMLSLESNKSIKGRVVIEDPVLRYDNHFFFNIDKRNKPKVLAISEEDDAFLERIFSQDGFEFIGFNLNTLDYSLLESQNTIVLNGLKTVPNGLSSVLLDFSKNGGSLVVIPAQESIDLPAYNRFLQQLLPAKFESQISSEQRVSGISFEHPLYQNVFEKEVTNFDYPKVNSYYKMSSKLPTALSYDDFQPFLAVYRNTYVFSASMNRENSNFIGSPLIVPTFFNIGEKSLKNPALYQTVGTKRTIDVLRTLGQDNILKISNAENEFIPLQQTFSNKVQLEFGENPKKEGIYSILDGKDTVQNLSFNYARQESQLSYLNSTDFAEAKIYNSIPKLFDELREDTSISNYWKWFVIFALLFAMLELLIQKLLP